jgi:plastocyanin
MTRSAGWAATVAVTLLVCRTVALAGTDAGTVVNGVVSLPPGTGSVKDVVVYLEGTIAAPKPGKAVMEQKDMVFLPHVLPVVAGSSVEFRNSDAILHNVFSNSATNRFDLGMFGQGESRLATFSAAGVVEVRCNVHPTMQAFVVVLDNNYFAQPDERGHYQITGIPPGRYRLRGWHPSLPAVEGWANLDDASLRTVDLNFKPQ